MDFLQYIIKFLAGEEVSSEIINLIGYTDNADEFFRYKLIIYPSGFFNENVYGTEQSIPGMPLVSIENTPILFGNSKIEKRGNTIILYADIIAGAYFLISRYEEMLRRTLRDTHGRFPGKESLPYRASFIKYPIVDKYGYLLRNLLKECGFNIPEPEERINKIYLTHDVDFLSHYRNSKGFLGSFRKIFTDTHSIKTAFKSYFGDLNNDPYYTFPFLYSLNKTLYKKIDDVETIAFIRSGRSRYSEDKPYQNIFNKDFQQFFDFSKKNNVKIGLHASYEAGIKPDLIQLEKKRLEQVIGNRVISNRHHFLSSREPEDMEALIHAGITHDFTMGYADVAGFRLGTSKAVRWINPQTKQLTDLILHPLTVMDSTLSNERYMNLNEQEAYTYSIDLIKEVKKYSGDLCLLWHNTSVVEDTHSYHRHLYTRIIQYLLEKE